MNAVSVVAEYLCPECERIFAGGDERCPYDGTRLVNLGAGLASGTVIDNRYTIKRLLGKGGMGSVYVARQHSMDRDVAIKIMHHRSDGNQASVQRFFWEVRAARRLQNAHTITVFDFGQTERGSLYLAMELLKGTTLGQRLSSEGRLPPSLVMRVGMQICRSLEEAHGHGIIHRDLKPENIFLCQRGGQPNFVKVLDFGVAKFLDPDGQLPLTQTGTVFGTPRYMSPEQANSEPVDARSDLYSLGIMLYEMLAGRVPFAEDNPLEILYKHVHAKPLPLAEVLPGQEVPAPLSELVDRMLSKRREDRPLSATLVRQVLEAALGSTGEAASPFEADPHDRPPPLPFDPSPEHGAANTAEVGSNTTGIAVRTALPTPSLGLRGLRRDGSTTQLVGRRSEQQRARRVLDQALRDGSPRILWLTGEAGLGKRRFLQWLGDRAREDLQGRFARGLQGSVGAGDLAELRTLFDDILETTLLERTALRDRLEDHPAFSDRLERDLIDALVSFLRPALGPEGTRSGGEDAPALHSALHRLLVRLARIQPLLVDFGLLNGADQSTLRFVEYLAAVLPKSAARLAIAVRVDTPDLRRTSSLRAVQDRIGWRGGAEGNLHEHLHLTRLDGPEFLELAQTIGRGFGHLAPYLLYLSGGNPAAAAALVRAVEARPEHLQLARGWNPVTQRVPLAELPADLLDRSERLLEAGLQRLADSKDAQLVLRHAALLGHCFDVGLLERALAREERPEVLDAVEQTLDALIDAGCLHEEREPGRLRFDSGVLRELLLARIRSPRALKRLHGLIAATLEAEPEAPGRALEIAQHLEGADEHARALRYRLEHARRTRASGHTDESLQAFGLAYETSQRLEPGPERAAAEREILLALGRLRFEVGTYQLAAESFQALLDRALALGDARLVADAQLGLAEVQEALAEYGAASELLVAAAERFRALGAPLEAARCDLRRAASLERRGQGKAAREGYEVARRTFAQHQDQRGLAETYHALGLLSLHEGDSAEALRQLRRAADLLRQLGGGLGYAKVLLDLAHAAYERREYVLALDSATRALELFDKEVHRLGVSQCLGMIARVLLQQHRPAEARPFYERALRIREDLGDRRGVGEVVAALANIALSLDQPERALELARRAREIYASVSEFVGAASALRTMGMAERVLQRYENALAHLREAIATYRGLGKKDAELSLILESLADCQGSIGLHKDARDTLAEALAVARELNVAHQVAHLEARLRSRLVPGA